MHFSLAYYVVYNLILSMSAMQDSSITQVPVSAMMKFKPFNLDEARLLKGKLKAAVYHPPTNCLVLLLKKPTADA